MINNGKANWLIIVKLFLRIFTEFFLISTDCLIVYIYTKSKIFEDLFIWQTKKYTYCNSYIRGIESTEEFQKYNIVTFIQDSHDI